MILSRRKLLKNQELLNKLLELNSCSNVEELCSKNNIHYDLKDYNILLNEYSNKYLWYIEDEDFEEIVNNLIEEYQKNLKNDINEKKFFDNRLDIPKMIIDISLQDISVEDWIEKEVIRQEDRSNTNIIGFFNEKIIGKIDGWNALKVGEGIDIENDDKTIFIELKNKHNTVKKEDEVGIYEKLESKLQSDTSFKRAYYARIIDKKSRCEKWTTRGGRVIKDTLNATNREKYENNPNYRIDKKKIYRIFDNDNVYIISGDRLYEMLTGDKYAFKKLIEALPCVFKNLGYGKSFNEYGQLENYLIYKNFSLSKYLGYENVNFDKNLNEISTKDIDNFRVDFATKEYILYKSTPKENIEIKLYNSGNPRKIEILKNKRLIYENYFEVIHNGEKIYLEIYCQEEYINIKANSSINYHRQYLSISFLKDLL
jgi:hypothetical protein